MPKTAAQQVLFLILVAIAIFFLLGMLLVTNSQAQGLKNDFSQDWDWEDDWDDDWDNFGRVAFDSRYNRAEGFYTGIRLKRDVWYQYHPYKPFLFGFAGWAFAAKEFQYQFGIEKGFFETYRFAVGGEYHRLVDTPDRWRMNDLESGLYAFLIKEDYHDYYLNEGWSVFASQNLTRALKFTGTYHTEFHDSLERETNWALFGGGKNFPRNPGMDEGKLVSFSADAVLDTRNRKRNTTRGWYVQMEYEKAGDGLGGDFSYDRWLIDVRRYQKLWLGETLDLRLMAGSIEGEILHQRGFYLGGVSTLRGFRYKEYPAGRFNRGGNRMLLAQLEYRFGGRDFAGSIDLGILEHFTIIIFSDLGWIGSVEPDLHFYEGYGGLDWGDFKHDLGIALSNNSGSVRAQIARRTDTGHKPYVFMFRIYRPF